VHRVTQRDLRESPPPGLTVFPDVVADADAGPAGASQGSFRQLLDAMPLPAWVFDVETLRFLEVNHAAVTQYRYSRAEFLQRTIAEIRPEEDLPALLDEIADVRRARHGTSRLWRHKRADGSLIDVQIWDAPITYLNRLAKVIVANDVTLLRRLSDTLQAREEQLREAQILARMGSWELDVATATLAWSHGLPAILGFGADEPSTPADLFASVHPSDRSALHEQLSRTVEQYESGAGDFRLLVGGAERWIQTRTRVVDDGTGHPARIHGVCQDVTGQKLLEASLTRRALHDSLTDLPNRVLFMNRLEHAAARLQRHPDAMVAVLFVDLDRFKSINDSLGHAAGDLVVVELAQRLRGAMRLGDTVARLGGDEFAILCEDVHREDDVSVLAARLLRVVSEPAIVDGKPVVTTASIGIAMATGAAASPDTLLREADSAMYQAKQAGRDRYEVFDHEARERTAARRQRADELALAIRDGQLRLFFQPAIQLDDESLLGVEALVRWQHPHWGLVGPSEFISVAEDSGLIVELGAWVLEEACRQIAAWDASGMQPALDISVNVSARQLTNGDLVDVVADALTSSGIDPGRLCLEITESVLMEDVSSSIEALRALKSLGIRLAVDDFGTGYSSLSYLRRFPIDIVKIDRSFVADLSVDAAADAVVAAIVNLSHALGLTVVAEGVETHEQLVALRALRCDLAQGFYWSRPLPAADFTKWRLAPQVATPTAAPLDVYELLAERIDQARESTGRSIVLQGPPTLAPAFAEGGAVRSIVDHLLSNAAAYSPPDTPVLVSAAADRRWVRVSVADYGSGMSDSEAKRCFEQFWQAGARPTNGRRGTGIGLFIVRSLVETMGGQVSVKTAAGKGATFTVALPRTAKTASRGLAGTAGVGEDSSIREFMRQLGVPTRGTQ
jgi:diguanylate cyclase (GGDEF)-like protein/PAS domain S-box-containing protein